MQRHADTMAAEACGVCAKAYTNEIRRPVTCLHCGFSACKACTKTYIETSAQVPARCMNCFHEWDRGFIARNFPQAWISEQYKGLWKRQLIEREKALLPMSQIMVANYRVAQSLELHIDKLDEEIDKCTQFLRSLRLARDRTVTNLHNVSANNYRGRNNYDVKTVFSNRSCPAAQCRGFLDGEWRCGLCMSSVCRSCYALIVPGRQHTCNDQDVASMNLIQQSSKPCPNCGMAIHQTDGCDQMWCTVCRTAFSWQTGDIDSGRIHNPHYRTYMQQRPREVGDIPCGGLCSVHDLRKAATHTRSEDLAQLLAYRRSVDKLSGVQSKLQRLATVHDPLDHSALRLSFLLGRISEEQWSRMLYTREITREKNVTIRQIYETYLWSVSETLSAFVAKQMDVTATTTQLHALLNLANKGLQDAEAVFRTRCPRININE
jgi:hypothetical protein